MSIFNFFKRIDNAFLKIGRALQESSDRMEKASEELRIKASLYNATESAKALRRMLELKTEMGAPAAELDLLRSRIEEYERDAAALRKDISNSLE